MDFSCNCLNGGNLGSNLALMVHVMQVLDISYVFSLHTFPLELCGLTALEKLSLKCAYVHRFPREVSRLCALTSLDISFNSQLDNEEVCKVRASSEGVRCGR